MEYWESKTDDGLILNSDPCHLYKIRSHFTKLSVPAFQYSIIPGHRFTAQPIFSDLALRGVGSYSYEPEAQLPARRAYSPEGGPGFQ
jgi:hypothetical protein